ncbi:MAG: sigma-54-dependent Fis family transcriptional regulator, partial [Magnetococcales bacterium]|nr:sigma-54-dependent Fis family transcriptional regulator [Magnetococcales bacterium]
LFLDEISELPLSVQSKLLRMLENGECQVVGQTRTIEVDVRVIAATNRNLSQMVREGRFRADLFYRLHVVPLDLPPLRERSGDVLLLSRAFLEQFSQHNQIAPARIDSAAMRVLECYDWPGNIRELRNLCERLSILHAGQLVGPDDLPEDIRTPSRPGHGRGGVLFTLPASGIDLGELEQSLMAQALELAAGNKSRAARLLGLSRDTFLYRLKKWVVLG